MFRKESPSFITPSTSLSVFEKKMSELKRLMGQLKTALSKLNKKKEIRPLI